MALPRACSGGLPSRLLLSLLAVLPGCGAGLIGGAVANGGGTTSGPAQPPSLGLPSNVFPLVPTPQALARTVVVANSQLGQSANLQVQLRVVETQPDGRVDVLVEELQGSPTIFPGNGAATPVGFSLRTDLIVARFGGAADIGAQLLVLVDGRPVASPLEVTLLRQPEVRLFDPGLQFLSPAGVQQIRLAALGLRSVEDAGLQVTVVTASLDRPGDDETRVCQRVAFAEPVAGDPPLQAGERLVTALVPDNTFAGPARFFVDDVISGRSEEVTGAYYRPSVDVASPGQGTTRGGTAVTLIGDALTPLRAGTNAPDLDKVQLQLRKGDRIVDLPAAEIARARSSFDSIEFTMPPAPDGRPGDVDIVVRAILPDPAGGDPVVAEFVASGLFRYGNPEPVFGPRGTLLEGEPIALAPIDLEGAPFAREATDFGVLYAEGGAAALQLLVSQENGLFIRFGPVRRCGNPENESEHHPRGLLSGDFDRDGVPDLFIINGGSANVASHLVVSGQQAPDPPLGGVVRFQTPAGMIAGRTGDFDEDGHPDIVLLPGADALPGQRPLLLRSLALGGLATFLTVPVPIPAPSYRFEVLDVDDFDGDGHLDVAVGAGGVVRRFDVAYGRGDGSFFDGETRTLRYDVPFPGYVPSENSPAVGIHGLGPAPKSIAIVLAGLPGSSGGPPQPSPSTPPLVFVSHTAPASSRDYQQPPASTVVQGPDDPLRSSLATNFDGSEDTGNDDLLLGTSGTAIELSLGALHYSPENGQFTGVVTFTQLGREVRGLHAGVAFPADPSRQQAEARAVFVQHERVVDGVVERRLSTMLVQGNTLLPPDVGFDLPLQGLVGGRFSAFGIGSGGSTRDLALPSTGEIRLGVNNGFGALSPGTKMQQAGLVPETVSLAAGAPGSTDVLVFLDDGSRDGRADGQLRLGVWQPQVDSPGPQAPTALSDDLRPRFDAHFLGAQVDSSSRIVAADVDGDGHQDLVALLRFVGMDQADDAMLLVFHNRGAEPGPAVPFPFELPVATAITRVPGAASDLVLGDFVRDSAQESIRLELALAVPVDPYDHVQFYRFQPGATGDRGQFLRSFDSRSGFTALVAGEAPTRLAVADFDRDGIDDLLVAAEGDRTLRLYLNDGVPPSRPGEVPIDTFHLSFGSPQVTAPGRPTQLRLSDIDGDGNVDAILAVEQTLQAGALDTTVRTYLNGNGSLASGTLVSPTGIGARDARLSLDVGDINGDGVPDLSLGWHQVVGGGLNLRVLLGGSR